MKPIKPEDLFPEPAEFVLSGTERKTYHIRAMTIDDYAWLLQRFQGRDLEDVLKTKQIQDICVIAFRLMPDEEKSDFAARECVYFNEDTGERVPGRVGGGPLLVQYVKGMKELVAVVEAITKSLGAHKVLIQEQAVEEKKTADVQLVEAGSTSPVGPSGSTS